MKRQIPNFKRQPNFTKSKGSKETSLQRRYKNGQQAYEKMLNYIRENHNEITLHTHKMVKIKNRENNKC